MRKYKTIQGDTWDGIAYQNFGGLGREKLTSELISANPEYINLVIFPAGIELIIPDIDIPVVNSLPPWKS